MTLTGNARFIGQWRKTSREACAARYPAELRLDANGLYTGQADQPGEFTWWDSGTWRLHEAGVLALSVANDAVERYAFKFEERAQSSTSTLTLAFTDHQGCVIRYDRGG